MMTFVQATYVLARFVHSSNTTAVTDQILKKTLKLRSWEHLEQIPTVTVTFVQALSFLVTFVHIRNISLKATLQATLQASLLASLKPTLQATLLSSL